MYKFLFMAHLGICGLLIYSLFQPKNKADSKLPILLGFGAVTLTFCGIAILVGYLQMNEHLLAAKIILFGFYGLVLCYYLWLMATSNWR